MAFAVFGPGALYVTRTDITGATPINIGYVQEFSLDETGETKELFGSYQYPLAVARGTIKATGKAKAALISGQALNIFRGGATGSGTAFTAGQLVAALGESHSVPTVSPFTVAVTNATNFNQDLGVVYGATGLPLVKEAAATLVGAAGEYYSNNGTYTFDSLDSGAAVNLSYAWNNTVSSAGGQTQLVTNQLIGFAPTFQLDYVTQFQGKSFYLRLYSAICTKLTSSFKLTDFYMPELDFNVQANSAGNVYEVSYADVG
jgi:hypothetical protein